MICTSISEQNPDIYFKALNEVEMAEIRIDLIRPGIEQLRKIFSSHKNLIATCREGEYSNDERFEILTEAIHSGAVFVDIEIEAPQAYKKALIEVAKNTGCKVIISYHNYELTPSLQELKTIIDTCFEQGANIAKVAVMANSMKDSARILSLYEQYDDIVALCMGQEGKITRVAALYLGAPFTFAALNSEQKTAPGQLSINELNQICQNIS